MQKYYDQDNSADVNYTHKKENISIDIVDQVKETAKQRMTPTKRTKKEKFTGKFINNGFI